MQHDLKEIKALFSKCSKGIAAVGDETRQAKIIALMESKAEGIRVGAITEKTHLSRPAVSHHMKVLLDAEIVSVKRVGTMNFYYLNPEKAAIKAMLELCQDILYIMDNCEENKE